MQRRSLRGRVPERKLREPSPPVEPEPEPSPPPVQAPSPSPPQLEEPAAEPPAPSVPEPEAEKEPEEPPPPVKRRPGRPRRSEQKPKEPKPPILPKETSGSEDSGNVVLNARGMPVRQRKRNRFYADDEDEEPESPTRTKSDKKIKLEPLQILLDNPSNNLQVTPIISEVLEGDPSAAGPVVQSSLVHGKKSVVKIVMPPTFKVENGTPRMSTESKIKVGDIIPKLVPMRTPSSSHKFESSKTDGSRKMEFSRIDAYRRSDYSSFIRFFANVKTKVIMPDRWGINGVMFDPVRKMKTFTMCELEITPAGEPGVKKCIQVYEDLSLMVSVQGQDLTGKIAGVRRLQSEHDVPGVVSKISALKVCTGVKAFGQQDLNYHPTAKKKGVCYFSTECQTILSFNYVGALCPPCNKLRNAVRRRKLKVKQDREKSASKPNVRKVPSVFGRTLYGLLDQLISENKSKRNLKVGKDGIPYEIKQEPGTSGTGGRRRCGPTLKIPRKQRVDQRLRNLKSPGVIGTPMTISQLIDSGSGLRQTVLPQGLAEYITLGGDSGNIVIQNGGEFNFADGQEYELIGEADSVEPLQLMDPQEEQTIQIIEVDEQTMAQFQAQNMGLGGMFFSDPSNIQVTEIDPNDPNTMFKVIHPGDLFVQDRKV